MYDIYSSSRMTTWRQWIIHCMRYVILSEGAAEVEESPRCSEKHKNVGENTKMLYKHNKIVLY